MPRKPVDWAAVAAVPLPEMATVTAWEEQERYDGLRFADLDLGDVRREGAVLHECAFETCRADELHLRRARLRLVVLEGLQATTVTAEESGWDTVALRGARIGALTASAARLTRVTLDGVRVGYLNLRGATLEQVQLLDCTVDELDLDAARVRSLRLDGSRVRRLTVHAATLADVDLRRAEIAAVDDVAGLRGAAITEAQLLTLAPALAAAAGLRVLGLQDNLGRVSQAASHMRMLRKTAAPRKTTASLS